MSTLTAHMQQRNDTAENWVSENPVLMVGEAGFETDSNPMRWKVGDGTTAWNGLSYEIGQADINDVMLFIQLQVAASKLIYETEWWFLS